MEMEFDLMELKVARIRKNYTIKDMADKLDLSASTYSKKENGEIKISIGEFAKIANILNIDDVSIFFKKSVDKKHQI